MRRVASLMAVVLAASLLVAVQPPAPAAAAGPSVGLPTTPSVPVTQDTMDTRPADQATSQALHGDQPTGGTKVDGGGTPTATSLSPSATWSVSGQSGDFGWSYPLRVPPVPGGLTPDLALAYQSSEVDGRTSASNNQSSWIGDGWELNPGFVERTYGACQDDKEGTTPPDSGNLCWRSNNATAAFDGGGGMLICCDGDGKWRARSDDGSRIEKLGTAGGSDESWKITTLDGTQYFFGSRTDAKSKWTVPVFGDDVDEPCHGATFATSRCVIPWRWNLDKVVDANGNMILYNYQTETNSYAEYPSDAAVSYIRGGWLDNIDYGLHATAASTPAGHVAFTAADRCVPGSLCTVDHPENWPDTPLSERCEAATCKDHYSPTFWSTKRLASITTQVRRSGALSDVDRWTMDQQYPRPGDGEPSAALWLHSIVHTGLIGGSVDLPPVTFEGTALPNRVYQVDHLSPLLRFRITGIVSESGGVTSIKYANPDCLPGTSMPGGAQGNTLRCFPVTWARPGGAERTDWFHKYVVDTVTVSDRISSNVEEKYAYTYLGGAAWHYDTSEFTPNDKRTWNEFRGFAQVQIRHGQSNDPAGPITLSEQRFYRGMGGEITDTEGGKHTDQDWLAGFPLESATYLGDSATVVSKTLTDPVWQGPTATRGSFQAYLVGQGTQRTFTTLAQGRRETKVVTGYDDRGLPTTVDDRGDVGTASDDLCTRTTYARNTAAWLLSLPSRVESVSVPCATAPSYPDNAVSDQRTAYDDRGNPTKVEALDRYDGTNPVYTLQSTAGYDVHGRVTSTGDALGRTTRTAYTPAEGGPTTKTVVTDPKGFTMTIATDPALGLPVTVTDVNGRRTDTTYDQLGRVISAWTSDRPRNANYQPAYKFAYLVNRDAPTVVTTTAIGPNGNYVSTNQLYDGLLRLRQVQAPAVGGGRLLTDTRYDSQGRAYKTTSPYFNDAAVDGKLWRASDTEVPSISQSTFDGVGRQVESAFKAGAVVKWRTTTSYGGDRVSVTPPQGGTPSVTVTDARGRTVELHQASDVTKYAYDPAGHLSMVTDPAGNAWSYAYDFHGRQTSADHPDKGKTSMVYDAAGQLTSTTDARSKTITYTYDELGRPLSAKAEHDLAAWTYDTVPDGFGGVVKGQPATATSYDGAGNAFTSAVLAYTARYQPRQTAITIPASEKGLANTYTSYLSYNPDGSVAGESYPAVGGLFAEEVFHTYDDFGRPLTTYGGPDGSTVTYAASSDYTRYGELQRLQLGTGSKRVWLSQYYDTSTRRLGRTIVDAESHTPMQTDTHYQYDPSGNVTSIADSPQGQVADTQCFTYDYLRRLTQAWTPSGDCTADPGTLAGPAPYRQSFSYDVVGNRLSKVDHTSAGTVTTGYTYPAAGSDRPHALTATTGADATSYQYDAAGNTVARGDQQLSWDEVGHLAAVDDTTFVYDTTGQRLIRHERDMSTLYLGRQEIQLNRKTGALTAIRYYTHGGSTIAVRTGSGLTWVAGDQHGTEQVAIDSAKLTVDKRRFDPFGNPRGTQPTNWPDEKGFVGGTIDDTTGLTHLGARDYDPATGRFISADPIVDPANPQQINAYAYANNNPTTMSDPSGLYIAEGDYGYTDAGVYHTTPPPATKKKQSFCDSCEYYSRRDGTPSAWNPPAGQKKSPAFHGNSNVCSVVDCTNSRGKNILQNWLGGLSVDKMSWFLGYVNRYAAEAGIDPQLLLAILITESGDCHCGNKDDNNLRVMSVGLANMQLDAFIKAMEFSNGAIQYGRRDTYNLDDDGNILRSTKAAAYYIGYLSDRLDKTQLAGPINPTVSREEIVRIGYNMGTGGYAPAKLDWMTTVAGLDHFPNGDPGNVIRAFRAAWEVSGNLLTTVG